MLDENISTINFEILSPSSPDRHSLLSPDSRASSEEQNQYYEESKDAAQMARKRVAQVYDAVCAINRDFEDTAVTYKYSENLALDHFIQDLVWDFETATNEKASKNCYYSDAIGGYKGRFFDFVITILDFLSPKSYHSRGALGKRIVRVINRLD